MVVLGATGVLASVAREAHRRRRVGRRGGRPVRAARTVRIALAGGGTGGHLFPGLAAVADASAEPTEGRPVVYGSGKAAEAAWVGDAAERVALDAPHPAGPPDGACRGSCSALPAPCTARSGSCGPGGRTSSWDSAATRPWRRASRRSSPGGRCSSSSRTPCRARRTASSRGSAAGSRRPTRSRSAPSRAAARSPGAGRRQPRAARDSAPERRDPDAFGLPVGRPVLLVTGGSQGAEGLNRAVLAAADVLARRGISVIHLTGAAGRARGAEPPGPRAGVRAWVAAVHAEDGRRVTPRRTSFSAGRGGPRVAELAVPGKPSVLVPYPHHADRHQDRNARVLESRRARRQSSPRRS